MYDIVRLDQGVRGGYPTVTESGERDGPSAGCPGQGVDG